jgi:hypothetical protein
MVLVLWLHVATSASNQMEALCECAAAGLQRVQLPLRGPLKAAESSQVKAGEHCSAVLGMKRLLTMVKPILPSI